MVLSGLHKPQKARAFTSAQQGHSRVIQCRSIPQERSSPWQLSTAIGAAAAAAALFCAPMAAPPQMALPAEAALTAGDPVKNARAILRNALPIDNKPIRKIQSELESINEALRIPGSKSLSPISRSVRNAENTLGKQEAEIKRAFASNRKDEGAQAISELKAALKQFDKVLADNDKQEVPVVQQRCLRAVGDMEEAMVGEFPFTVPKEYAGYPQLKGRATLEMSYTLQKSRESTVPVTRKSYLVLDGYNAPVSAGCFLDLVQRQWYDGMTVQRADGFVVQTGKPEEGDGFVDPATNEIRRVPFEIKTPKDKAPVYELNLEDLGRPNDQPSLPFNAFGTLAWARAEFDNNSASSQVFWLLKESELTPSGANLLDGRYAVFGYITDGQEDLLEMNVGDKIQYIKCIAGCDNLQQPETPKNASFDSPI